MSSEGSAEFGDALLSDLVQARPAIAANVLSAASTQQGAAAVQAQPPDVAALLLDHLAPDHAGRLFAGLSRKVQVEVLHVASVPLAGELVSYLSAAQREELLAAVRADVAGEIREVLSFPAAVAGRLMDRRVQRFAATDTLESALARLRASPGRRVTDLLIVDAEGKLEALLPLHVAVAAPPESRLGDLPLAPPVAVGQMTSTEETVELAQSRALATVPVVDLDGVVQGVIRYDELLAATREEAVGAALAMVGASREERALSSPLTAIRSRLPWLQINLLTAFLASAVVGAFDDTIARVTSLAVLMPVVAGQSGNTGAQALAVTQRGLALREIRTSQIWRVAAKEAGVGLGAGIAIALVTGAGVWLWSGQPMLAVVISVAMVGSMVLAAVAGAIIPIALTKLGRDPATASSIVLTTVTDIVGFSSFLGLATIFSSALV